MAWGLWRLPESKLRLLGTIRGRDVLELGCGAGRWAEALARRGARVVGLDQSRVQLAHARHRGSGAARPEYVLANAERIPLRDRSFDVLFSDYGALTFADPRATIPEAARLLRPGGILVFSTTTPFRAVAEVPGKDRLGRRLRRAYFELGETHRDAAVEYQLPYGAWIRLFRDHGFEVEELREPRPPAGARSGYLARNEVRWAERWPIEAIWKLRRRGPA